MSFESHVYTPSSGEGHEVSHTRGGDITGSHRHAVYVCHYPKGDSRGASHVVIVNNGVRTSQMYHPSEQYGAEKAYLGRGKYGAPPSPELKVLIERHGEHPDEWMPLLDKLAEEYPDMMRDIDAHVAARNES